mgnify:CR=1 FL=1
MEAWALWALKALAGLAAVLVVLAAVRAALRVFRRSRSFFMGASVSVIAGILYLLFSRSMIAATTVTIAVAAALFLVWIISAYMKDNAAWAQCRTEDTFNSYANYLRQPSKMFKTMQAAALARQRLREQVLFFSLLQRRNTSPICSIPLALGNVISQRALNKAVILQLDTSSSITDVLESYSAELKRRDQLVHQLGLWKKEKAALDALNDSEKTVERNIERTAKADEQLPLHEQLIRDQKPLLDPSVELSAKAIASIESRLAPILERAFTFVLPSELLRIVSSPSAQESKAATPPALTLKYKLVATGVGEVSLVDQPKESFSFVRFKSDWNVVLSASDIKIEDSLEIIPPSGFTSKYGINRLYAYLIVRTYADFAWELLRSMGFVSKQRFDGASEAITPDSASGDGKELMKEFRKEMENVLEGQITEIAASGVLAAWAQRNESELRDLSRQIEDQLSEQLKQFFEVSMESMISLLPVPDLTVNE